MGARALLTSCATGLGRGDGFWVQGAIPDCREFSPRMPHVIGFPARATGTPYHPHVHVVRDPWLTIPSVPFYRPDPANFSGVGMGRRRPAAESACHVSRPVQPGAWLRAIRSRNEWLNEAAARAQTGMLIAMPRQAQAAVMAGR